MVRNALKEAQPGICEPQPRLERNVDGRVTVRPVRPVILLVVVSTKGGGISPSVDAQSDGESDQFDDELEILMDGDSGR